MTPNTSQDITTLITNVKSRAMDAVYTNKLNNLYRSPTKTRQANSPWIDRWAGYRNRAGGTRSVAAGSRTSARPPRSAGLPTPGLHGM